MNTITWKLRKVSDGYEGMIVLPGATWGQVANAAAAQQLPGAQSFASKLTAARAATPLAVKSGPQPDAASAIDTAASLAQTVLDNPLVRDLLPPGTNTAISVAKGVANAIKSGAGSDAINALSSGAKSLAQSLKFW